MVLDSKTVAINLIHAKNKNYVSFDTMVDFMCFLRSKMYNDKVLHDCCAPFDMTWRNIEVMETYAKGMLKLDRDHKIIHLDDNISIVDLVDRLLQSIL